MIYVSVTTSLYRIYWKWLRICVFDTWKSRTLWCWNEIYIYICMYNFHTIYLCFCSGWWINHMFQRINWQMMCSFFCGKEIMICYKIDLRVGVFFICMLLLRWNGWAVGLYPIAKVSICTLFFSSHTMQHVSSLLKWWYQLFVR